ncbi:hypothetical protein [Chryseobacterium mucoviscidosis]|uniref:hypothetical protein n=1 Tax=Chryseobacterium mucoviscidosis TaxID=1945581 RepID=UPI0031DF55C8
MSNGYTKEEMENMVKGVRETCWTENNPRFDAGKITDKLGIEKYYFTWKDVGTLFFSALIPECYHISKYEGKREDVQMAFGNFINKYTDRYK